MEYNTALAVIGFILLLTGLFIDDEKDTGVKLMILGSLCILAAIRSSR
jgi:membrane-bound ClpP family serine protease